MRPGNVFYTLGYGGVSLAVAMLIPLAASLALSLDSHAQNFTVGFLLTIFVSGALILSGLSTRHQRARNSELLLTMILFWSVLPVPAGVPLTSSEQLPDFAAAYFEAVSGLTTSGGTIIAYPDLEAAPILLWRALLGWMGGLWTLLFGVAVLAPLAIGGLTLTGSPLLQHDENASLSTRLWRPLKIILPLYAGLTLLAFIAIAAGGAAPFEALCLALSAVSTTGFITWTGDMSSALSPMSQTGLAAFCFVGALGLPLLLGLTRRRGGAVENGFAGHNRELRLFIKVIVIYAIASYIFVPSAREFATILQSISLASTAGFVFADAASFSVWPVLWVLVPVLLGGMSLSTAGGVKMARAMIFARDIGNEAGRLAYPSSVDILNVQGRRATLQDFAAVRSYLLIFLIFIAAALIVLGAFGVALSNAWPLVLTALSNSTALISGLPDAPPFAAYDAPVQVFIAFVSIAGRIDMLIFILLLDPSFWRSIR